MSLRFHLSDSEDRPSDSTSGPPRPAAGLGRWWRSRRQPDEGPRTLADVGPGRTVTVRRIDPAGRQATRLMQMGMVEGTAVTVIRRAPAGDPIEVRVAGYALSLRRDEARAVEVEE